MSHLVFDLIDKIRDTLVVDADVIGALARGDEGVYVMPSLVSFDATAIPKPFILIFPFKWERVELDNSRHYFRAEIFLDVYPSDKWLAEPLTVFSGDIAKIESVLKGTTLANPTLSSNKTTLDEETGLSAEYIETETERIIRYTLIYRYYEGR